MDFIEPAGRVAPADLLTPKARTLVTDHQWVADPKDVSFRDHVFVRSSAKKRQFTSVDFRYSTFDASYMRECRFDSCDFTGCRFVATSFHGSTFIGCKFDYASFERTLIDSSVLESCCPAFENLKSRFARALRVNYQAVGDTKAANKAILVELDATREHLYKAWRSNESYYRKKFTGLGRLKAFAQWLEFKSFDFVWGNGESAIKFGRSVVLILALIGVADTLRSRDPALVASYWEGLIRAPQIFLGTAASPFGGLATAAIVFCRLIALSLLVSILIRRLVRR